MCSCLKYMAVPLPHTVLKNSIIMVKKVLSKPAAVCLHWWKGEKNSALCNSECQDIFFWIL